jgi:DNA mismatch endonuclease (patch repair protein)
MSRVRSVHTEPELLVRRTAHGLGYRFRLHCKELPGCPDLVFPRHRAVIFVHGCFWHGHRGCKRSTRPSSNIGFWNAKLDANAKRDSANIEKLRKLGWRVQVVWECETRAGDLLSRRLSKFFKPDESWEGGRSGGR